MLAQPQGTSFGSMCAHPRVRGAPPPPHSSLTAHSSLKEGLRSLVLEGGLALLGEGPHALLLVRGREGCPERPNLRGGHASLQVMRLSGYEALLLVCGRKACPERPDLRGRGCKATWKMESELPWREAGPPNHHDDTVVSDL